MNTEFDLAKLILPEGLTDFFVVVDVFLQDNKEYHLFLDEKPHPPHPSEYKSKGFTDAKVVQDFPLRGKPVFLHIRRRKWQHVISDEVITSQFDFTQLGTQLSEEFAAFLKGIHRK